MKKTVFALAFYLCLTQGFAQEKTLFLPDVSISAPASGKKSSDSSRILPYENSVVDGLRLSPEIFVKNYGPGTSASLGIRGTAAAHSTILWKGIPVGNPMLAMTDLSLLPGLLLEKAQIHTGGPALAGFSGNFGGYINLNSGITENRNRIRLGSTAGSFGQFQNWISAGHSFRSITISIRAWHQVAQNNFRYLLENEPKRQFHAAKKDLGLMAELDAKLKSNWHWRPAIWIQKTNREIGPSVFESQADALQDDQCLRIVNPVSKINQNSELEFSHAFVFQKLNYESKTAGIDSRNEVFENFIQAKFGLKFNRFEIGVHGFQTISKAFSNNFSGKPEQWKSELLTWSSIAFLPEILIFKGQIHALNYSHTEISNRDFFLLPSFQLEYKNNIPGILSIGISRKARVPGLNDLFWMNSGNPDLKSEKGWTMDFNWNKNFKMKERLSFSNRFSAFAGMIDDYIQWIPNGGIWKPNNIAAVRIQGFSIHPQLEWKVRKLAISAFGQFQMTQSIQAKSRFEGDHSVGKQMMYVPIFNSVLGLKSKLIWFEGLFWVEKTGIRYTNPANENKLPSYLLLNARLSYQSDFSEKFSLNAFLEGFNLLGHSYQSVQGFPMPLRQFKIGLIIAQQ